MAKLDTFVAILLVLGDKIVIQRRDNNAPVNPGCLDLFGGRVEQNETPADAIHREISEETSLDIKPQDIKLLFKYKSLIKPSSKNRHDIYIYRASIATMDFKVYEGDGAEAYTFDELSARDDLAYGWDIILRKLEEIKW